MTTRSAHVASTTVDRDAFLLVVLTLMFFGFLMIYSATSVPTRQAFTERHFIQKQVVWAGVALLGLIAAMAVKPRHLRRIAPAFFAVSVVLLVLVLRFGPRVNNARRWFRFGPVGVQVSELAKIGLILFLAHLLSSPPRRWRPFRRRGAADPVVPVRTAVRSFRTFVLAGGSAAVASALILVEPDFGCAFFLGGWALLMLLVAGVRWWYVAGALAAAAPAAWLLILHSSMHARRLMVFLDPWQDRQGTGLQLVQSLIALGSGGLTGVGLGQSQQRLSFLPEAPTDFIYAIVGEQLGVVGTGAVLALFGLLLLFGGRIVAAAPDRFSFLLGFGALSMIILQALLHVAVATGAVPTKGAALPFVSFGGSGLVWAAVSAGFVLNAAQRTAQGAHALDGREATPSFAAPAEG